MITLGFGRYKIEGVGPDIVGDNPGVTYTAQVGAPVRAVFGGEVVSISKVGAPLLLYCVTENILQHIVIWPL
ncbi:hypothetical protein LWM68_05485 [Niabella sp. W65]|nr:hypothetical protein [Niabella sp. W65]MCH7362262.1 hypothetical protein [Niabella sp. W65]ULT46003.1 hypothetical protein KRR40_24110 [Niabella sp. I65]